MSQQIQSQILKVLFVCAFFIFASNSLHAQNFVPKEIALERLEVKLDAVYKEVQQGLRPIAEKQIATQFVNYMVEGLENNSTVAQALQLGFSKTNETFSLQTNLVATFNQELELLLKL